MSPYPGRITDYQRASIRRGIAPLRVRFGTIVRIVGAGSAGKAPVTVATHVPYRRGAVVPGSLRGEPGGLELLTVITVQVAVDVDLRARDTLTDEADGMELQITAVTLDVERRGSLIALAQVNS
jgi:hypothetical protein